MQQKRGVGKGALSDCRVGLLTCGTIRSVRFLLVSWSDYLNSDCILLVWGIGGYDGKLNFAIQLDISLLKR